MTLLAYLKDNDSPIVQWLHSNWPNDRVVQIVERSNVKMATNPVIANYDVDPIVTGVAFRYAFRILAGKDIDPSRMASTNGVLYHNVKNEISAYYRLLEMTKYVRDSEFITKVSLILAWYEGVFKVNKVNPSLKKARHQYSKHAEVDVVISAWMKSLDWNAVYDIRRLVDTIPGVWEGRLNQRYIDSPELEGAYTVGGAYPAWIVGDCIYECKPSWQHSPMYVGMLRQSAAYALLDWSNKYDIKRIGVYFPRQQYIVEVNLSSLWGGDEAYAKSKESFKALCRSLYVHKRL